jgi:1,4-alpha-glucan branching enzyme
VQNGQTPVEAEKIHRDGFFQAKIPNATRDLDYHLRVTNWDGSQYAMRDPYQYGPIMGEVDLHLFSEGQHWQLYEKFGAHMRKIGDAAGVYFASGADAQRVVWSAISTAGQSCQSDAKTSWEGVELFCRASGKAPITRKSAQPARSCSRAIRSRF